MPGRTEGQAGSPRGRWCARRQRQASRPRWRGEVAFAPQPSPGRRLPARRRLEGGRARRTSSRFWPSAARTRDTNSATADCTWGDSVVVEGGRMVDPSSGDLPVIQRPTHRVRGLPPHGPAPRARRRHPPARARRRAESRSWAVSWPSNREERGEPSVRELEPAERVVAAGGQAVACHVMAAETRRRGDASARCLRPSRSCGRVLRRAPAEPAVGT